MSQPETVIIGLEIENVVDLKKTLDGAIDDCFDYICVPLVHPNNQRVVGKTQRSLPLTRSDLVLPSSTWTSFIVGKVSPWLNFDSDIPEICSNARAAYKQEVAWASHLTLSALLLPTPDWNCYNYASCVLSSLLNIPFMSMWIETPLVSTKQIMMSNLGTENNYIYDREDDPWERWNKMRLLCQHHKNLRVALVLTADLPSDDVISRWTAEPISIIIVPTDVFLTNKKGFPVLSKRHQSVLLSFFQFSNIQVIVRGTTNHENGLSIYQQYITWLWRQTPQLTELEKFEKPYWDYLQSPLQPLMDNLESQTYEVFEKDPIKYKKYEEAIVEALNVDPFLKDKEEVTLMVLGAGRGPLVFAAMRAAKTTNRKLKLYAIEKNPNAVNTLMNLRENHPDWEHVEVISSDIRKLFGDSICHKADVVVSELLGSFGDNELSPECLYGAQYLLKEGGISIPADYTSYLAPMSTVKLYNEIANLNNKKGFEKGYVVKYHAAHVIAEPQDCFTFLHPSHDTDCTRYKRLKFKSSQSALIHGFAGYFDSKLYGSVYLSILPSTATQQMFSWFPLYIPVKTPIYVPANSELEVSVWRLTDGKKVWYEWTVNSGTFTTPVHNPNGRSWWVGL
eukprot:TRINITY_DN7223_c0_g1_i1.p1 TRINITY_DN7223_c0_g1~~TRINITY_DN7223_c0_g1_i1.p1  ORF type:complete len:620 (-),score=124.58 TRINITY_DN7223_c0_g1_i1:101-1960(-)